MWRLSRRHRPRSDDGFLLLESIVAMGIVSIVMAALATLLVTVGHATHQQRARQAAAQLTVSALDQARAVGAAGAVSGRDQTSATAQLNHTPASADYPATTAAVAPWLASMSLAYDSASAPGTGTSAALPTVALHQQLDGTTYSISDFVGYCWRLPATDGDCGSSQPDGAVQYVRVVVAVAWPGTDCAGGICSYVSATLLDGTGDPVFNFNQSAPAAPVLAAVPHQVSAVNTAVDGLKGVSGCASPCPVSASGGVPPMIFSATGLPDGLTMDGTGLITGKPTATGDSTVTITVTDAFLNTDTEQFTWSVVQDPLRFDAPADRSSKAGDAVSVATTGASGGLGAPYSWSASGLPAGVGVDPSTGVISGTLAATSAAGSPYQVTVTLTDSSGTNQVSHTFTWTVVPVLSVTAPGSVPPTSAGGTVSATASYTCPNAPCTFGASGLPPGITVTGHTGTTSGTITLSGTVTGSSGTYEPTLTATDATGAVAKAAFGWPVVAAPTLQNPGGQSSKYHHNSTYPLSLSSSCPLGTCQFTVQATRYGSAVSVFSIDSFGTVTATDPDNATYSITATITDADGSATSVTFDWSFS